MPAMSALPDACAAESRPSSDNPATTAKRFLEAAPVARATLFSKQRAIANIYGIRSKHIEVSVEHPRGFAIVRCLLLDIDRMVLARVPYMQLLRGDIAYGGLFLDNMRIALSGLPELQCVVLPVRPGTHHPGARLPWEHNTQLAACYAYQLQGSPPSRLHMLERLLNNEYEVTSP